MLEFVSARDWRKQQRWIFDGDGGSCFFPARNREEQLTAAVDLRLAGRVWDEKEMKHSTTCQIGGRITAEAHQQSGGPGREGGMEFKELEVGAGGRRLSQLF